MLTGKNIIGQSYGQKGKEKFSAYDPSLNANINEPTFFDATNEEVNQAANLAAQGFDSYRKLGNHRRAEFLEAIASQIEALGGVLIYRAMQETGLPQARLEGERERTVGQLRLFANYISEGSYVEARIDTSDPSRKPLPRPDLRMMQVAMGPVVVFGASNFPLAFSVAGGDTASALAAGCPVIVKAHPAHPGTSELVGDAIKKAAEMTGMPEGVFSMLHGKSYEVGVLLVKHPAIKAIAFTGSYTGGKALFDLANVRPEPIPVYAEMGSINPVFILPDALKNNTKNIAAGLAGSISLGVGQFCTNPGLIVSLKNTDSEFYINELKNTLGTLAAAPMLTPTIKNAYLKGVNSFEEKAHVSKLTKTGQPENSSLAVPTLFKTDIQSFLDDPSLSEEVFGPSSLITESTNKEDIFRVAESLSGHLTATIHATEKDLEDYSELVTILEKKVGRIIFNGYPTGVEVTNSMMHGGPFPASTNGQYTSVGTNAIKRFLRPVSYQNFPQQALPKQLQNDYHKIWRLIDGEMKK